MAQVSVLFRNGKVVDFETANFKITKSQLDPNTGRHTILDMEWFKKDNGQSLLFADYSEIICIIRDTRKNDE